MDAKERPFRSPDQDPVVHRAEAAAREIISETARRRPWNKQATADTLAATLLSVRQLRRYGQPPPGR
jgi:hypothetical protein